MTPAGRLVCVALVWLCASALWAHQPAQADVNSLFEQTLDQVFPREQAKVATGDTRITLRVLPPKGHESQVVFLLHGTSTSAQAMQAVSVRQEFDKWMAAGQTPDVNEWAKTIPVQKAPFEVSPELRKLLESYGSVDFVGCMKQQDTYPGAIQYELWVETAQNVKDFHAYSTHTQKCDGLKYMQQLRQAVRQQVPQLERSSQ